MPSKVVVKRPAQRRVADRMNAVVTPDGRATVIRGRDRRAAVGDTRWTGEAPLVAREHGPGRMLPDL